MNFVRLLPVILSFLILAAHFLRYSDFPLMVIALMIPTLLFIKNRWVPRIIQLCLAIGAMEWLSTMFFLIQARQHTGADWQRLAVIMSLIALFTLLSGMVFLNKKLKGRYQKAE
ncbi:MAG: hypothetical protein OEY01_13485 [Desulfobulbaceae bacterium]|nr:hypothetical protein [Desulfobulbaceae bacterium]HIJ79742.1 hypothetical protein [Deltaproteobacteria bacterium]